MQYEEFYDIAVYGNENWRGSFTVKEIAKNAYDYLCDYEWSKENDKVAHSMQELAKLLTTDGSEECKEWLYQIASGLGLIDMNYQDYLDTDDFLTVFMQK